MNLSHVGMIIHSTTLNTEAKVKAIYGSNTSWIQHSGYVLRGATSGVVANSATKTGGEDTHILTVNEIPSHRHSGSTGGTGKVAGYTSSGSDLSSYVGAQGYTNYEGGGKAHNNLPNYKSVYIWERTA